MGTRSLSLRSSGPARASKHTGRESMSTPDVPLPGLLAATGLLAVAELATARPRAWLVDRLGPHNALEELPAKRYVFCADDAGRSWARVEWIDISEDPYELVDHAA